MQMLRFTLPLLAGLLLTACSSEPIKKPVKGEDFKDRKSVV